MVVGEPGMHTPSLSLRHPHDIDIENNVDTDGNKDTSRDDLSDDESADRYHFLQKKEY